MNPFYFGTGQRRLFGVYEPAIFGSAGTCAAVLCYPWGTEYLHAHRAMRQLAIKLSVAGFHTLRFDFFGTGDSAGETTEANLTEWQTDIELAMEELKEITGAMQVTLIGMRIGGSLAAEVAMRHPDEIDALVLWDAVISGPEYLQSIGAVLRSDALHVTPTPANSRAIEEQLLEIHGTPLTANMMQDLQAIDLGNIISALSTRTLMLVTERSHFHNRPCPELVGDAKSFLTLEHIKSFRPWIEDTSGTGALPAQTIGRIVEWLA